MRSHRRTLLDALIDTGIGFCFFMFLATVMGGFARDVWLIAAMAALMLLSVGLRMFGMLYGTATAMVVDAEVVWTKWDPAARCVVGEVDVDGRTYGDMIFVGAHGRRGGFKSALVVRAHGVVYAMLD